MNKNITVSVVIPNWNGIELLRKNAPSLVAAKNNKKNHILEIIVIDDASTDESVSFLKKSYEDQIRIVVHKENRGFASAVNTGVRSAKGELICLLNSDVIPSKDFLENVIGHFDDEKVFAVSLHEKGYGPAGGSFKDGFIEHSGRPEASVATESFWASGGSAVMRRSVWMELKGFDEALLSPFYWEDVDLGYRAHKRGYRILWEPNAVVVHEHESTVGKLPKDYVSGIRERNQLLFIWKNLTSRRLFRKHIKGLLNRIIKHPGYIRIFIMALKKLKLVGKLRAREKKEAKISDEAIFAMFERA
ncbi:MAG TPA: glycosyltransferase family 2 protein [Patescibacteria group bacterium]